MTTSSKEQSDQYKNFIAILYNIELVWHLCEILYVDVVRGELPIWSTTIACSPLRRCKVRPLAGRTV